MCHNCPFLLNSQMFCQKIVVSGAISSIDWRFIVMMNAISGAGQKGGHDNYFCQCMWKLGPGWDSESTNAVCVKCPFLEMSGTWQAITRYNRLGSRNHARCKKHNCIKTLIYTNLYMHLVSFPVLMYFI